MTDHHPPPGLGEVHTRRAVVATAADPLRLHSGVELRHVEVAYETYGAAPTADNVVVVCHALTGDAHAAGHHGDPARRGWWDTLIGPGRAVDTDRYHVVCANLLGGCRGTTGPGSPDPDTGLPYGPDFPLLDVVDLVAVHRRLLQHLGVARVHAVVGGSLGGMQALQWVLDHPGEVDRALLIAASSRLSTENLAFSSVARQAILGDPDFHGGRYAEKDVVPAAGLRAARMLAHLTYVSAESLETRFGRDRDTVGAQRRLEPDFAVEHYLAHQGERFLTRFDANTYLVLSRVMDYLDPFPDHLPVVPREDADLPAVGLISFDSDWRFPPAHSARIAEQLAARGYDVAHRTIASPWGHDSFLLEPPGYHPAVARFLDDGLLGP
ncbi:homoserine O-acetyltransferase [Nocardioides sp.]|uniref:homoserine O-acetyltransferase MetX n=1 Tax=Nocardioides sp. TaxID=35761 RepID=UPI003515712B